MKIYISTDFEGVSGIVAWEQILGDSAEYAYGCSLLTDELNAAMDGAAAAGATSFVVNDSHASMRNLKPRELHQQATLISGAFKPLYMMQGLDSSFDAVFFIGYHGSIGHERAILSHSYNPKAIWEVKINGTIVGESGLNALVAAHFNVPIALVTGDAATAEEAEWIAPAAERIVVKESISRFAATNLHPEVACARIREGAAAAVRRLAEQQPPRFSDPIELEVTFLTADMAAMACWIDGATRLGPRTIQFRGSDSLGMFQRFVTVVNLTRGLAE
ncbi:MAG: Peptidase D-aminopeptidase [Chloroflexi bacterium]|jgi:D-amino peptidase|nr:Peptidase D-aminopeptidase [Chloroflexota bacterium]